MVLPSPSPRKASRMGSPRKTPQRRMLRPRKSFNSNLQMNSLDGALFDYGGAATKRVPAWQRQARVVTARGGKSKTVYKRFDPNPAAQAQSFSIRPSKSPGRPVKKARVAVDRSVVAQFEPRAASLPHKMPYLVAASQADYDDAQMSAEEQDESGDDNSSSETSVEAEEGQDDTPTLEDDAAIDDQPAETLVISPPPRSPFKRFPQQISFDETLEIPRQMFASPQKQPTIPVPSPVEELEVDDEESFPATEAVEDHILDAQTEDSPETIVEDEGASKEEAPSPDMDFALDLGKALSTSPSKSPAPPSASTPNDRSRTPQKPLPPFDLEADSPQVTADVTVTKVLLNDDTTLLQDFLERAKASKASKMKKRESDSNKRDSDVVKLALSSPRKVLEDMDTNSPMLAQKKRDAEALRKNTSSPLPNRRAEDDTITAMEDQTVDELSVPTSSVNRRRLRSAITKSQPESTATIEIRSDYKPFMLKRSEAQELANQTRTNTRRNKGGALSASQMVAKLKNTVFEDVTDREPMPGRRNVTFNDERMIQVFGEDSPDADDGAPTTQTLVKSRAKRARALGALNGTPAKSKGRNVLAVPDDEPDNTMDLAKGEPERKAAKTQPQPQPQKKLPVPASARARGKADQENEAAATTAKAQMIPRRSMVPRSSGRPRR